MKEQALQIITRLRKPSVILSIVSQVITVLILMGYQIDQVHVMTVAAGICTLLVTMGILSNPDARKKGYGDDILTCSRSGKKEKHVMVNGELVCATCGAIYSPEAQITQTFDT